MIRLMKDFMYAYNALMAEMVPINPETPQPRRIRHVVDALRAGAVIAYPTDSSYALACTMGNKAAIERIRQLRQFGRDHFFSLLCRDLSEIATYAKVENANFRLLKMATPGAYTFVLPATRQVPRWLAHDKRKTVGIRVSRHPVAQAIANEMDEPIMTVTAQAPGDELPLAEALDVRNAFGKRIEMIADAGATGVEPTTVVDLSGDVPSILRQGKGSAAAIGLAPDAV